MSLCKVVKSMIIKDIPSNGRYSFKNQVLSFIEKETNIKKEQIGFCFIDNQYLKLDAELYNMLKDLDTIKQYNKSLLAHNKILNKYK